MSATAVPLTPTQISQIRRWARRIAADGSDEELRAVARTIVRFADEAERLREPPDDAEAWAWDDGSERPAPPTEAQLARARDWAERVVANGTSDERKAAARAILLLCDDLGGGRGNGRDGIAAAVSARRSGSPPGGAGAIGIAVRRWRRESPLSLLVATVPAALLLLLFLIMRAAAPDLDAEGPKQGALVGAAGLQQLSFSIAGDQDRLQHARWLLDGEDVSDHATLAGGRIVLHTSDLADGPHEVEVSLPGFAPWSPGKGSWQFAVDTTPPTIEVTKSSLQSPVRTAYRLRGAAPTAVSIEVDGTSAPLEDGRFTVAYDAPPAKELTLVAKDAAGNTTESRLTVTPIPRQAAAPVRAVHVSADAWANDELRQALLALIDQKRINAVELDLKDESGVVGWNAPVPLARKAGAVRDIYDLRAAVKQLHDKGARVIGRLVVFRDPMLSEWAWRSKHRGMVIQTPDGSAYSGGYGGFTNFADADVRKYNIDIAEAAAKLGVDDILYDYVRRPDGPLETMVFPGFEGEPEKPIVSFLAETRKRLASYGTFLGACVFGIAATRPHEIAQDVPLMAREVDYIAPMLYPSHWGPYEYEIPNPDSQPYDIVFRSLADFEKAVHGTGARVVPWLQDFSLVSDYGPAEVKAQIAATADAGIHEFLLWDPAVTYTASALARSAKLPTVGTAKPEAGSDELVELEAVASNAQAAVNSGLEPNELGVVPVLMHHQVLPDGGGDYDLTPEEFRDELERLYREHYRPITAADLVNGTIDVPRGTTPVVLTFDDSTSTQAALTGDGTIDPNTAVGIMLDFAKEHPDFKPAATFYLNRDPFAAEERTGELMRWLVANGFELGNHTRDHILFTDVTREEVQRQIVLEQRIIHESVPDYEVTTMALTFGVPPEPPSLAWKGSWGGESYRFKGVMLVGAEPAPSPFSRAFDPTAIPRIRSFPTPDLENGSAYWLNRLAESPELRYVSDGDPTRITFPQGRSDDLADRFEARASTY